MNTRTVSLSFTATFVKVLFAFVNLKSCFNLPNYFRQKMSNLSVFFFKKAH